MLTLTQLVNVARGIVRRNFAETLAAYRDDMLVSKVQKSYNTHDHDGILAYWHTNHACLHVRSLDLELHASLSRATLPPDRTDRPTHQAGCHFTQNPASSARRQRYTAAAGGGHLGVPATVHVGQGQWL